MTRDSRPARVLPLLYLGTAHASLALACGLAALWPRAVAGFFYHPWMVAIVHLVTIGWITFSILGSMYIVGPVALRMPMPVRRADYVAYAFAVIGVVGMIAHFWIEEFGGMAWSAATVTAGVLFVAVKIVRGVRRASLPAAIALHIVLACLNFGVAASMGILLGFDKAYHFLPGFVLSNVFAHAHLAALGWATMMVVGVAYRLLPMILPSRMPAGRSVFASAILLESGVIGLFVSLLLQSRWTPLFAIVAASGLATFVGQVVWMVRRPAMKPAGAPPVDFAVLHAAGAGVSLLMAIGLGLTLVVQPSLAAGLRAAAAYGVFGLVGFLAQMVVAMETRLLPLFTSFWADTARDDRTPPTPALAMRDRTLQWMVFAGWTTGVPAIAGGFWFESAALLAAGAWSLLAAVALGTLDTVFVLRHMARQDPQRTPTGHDQVQAQQRRHGRSPVRIRSNHVAPG